MEFLNIEDNKNFGERNGWLYSTKTNKNLDYIGDGYLCEELCGGLTEPICEASSYETGFRVTHVDCGQKDVFFFNNDGICVANTGCDRNQCRNYVNILPTKYGLLISDYDSNDEVVYRFSDYSGNCLLETYDFEEIHNALKYHLIGKEKE